MNELSARFGAGKMIRFTIPTILTMILGSVYGIVDGIFISTYVGKTAFAAVNFVMPVLMILGTIGLMFGTGGSALVGKLMGEQEEQKAKQVFSMLTYVLIAVSAAICILGYIYLPQILTMLGAKGAMHQQGLLYGRVSLMGLTFFILQYYFQAMLITAGKPKLNFFVTLAAGLTNVFLDYLFVAVLQWQAPGAAMATVAGQIIGGAVPIAYFALEKKGTLSLGKPVWKMKYIGQTCLNGSSELMTNIAQSMIGILFNWQLLRFAGEDGVAAYGVLMYLSMIFGAFFYGYSMGIAPVISYKYGADDKEQLHELYSKSLLFVAGISLVMFLSGELFAPVLSSLFTGYDPALYAMTLNAFHIFSFAFLFSGIAVFGSSFFTALNNGPVSALISFARTILFQIAFVILLPEMIGLNGIWLSIPIAEGLAACLTFYLLHRMKKCYGY